MGFLGIKKQTSSQSHIIYTDNVRRKSSFSLIVNDGENKESDFKEIAKHIATFEENSAREKGRDGFITDKNGNFMIVTELGANFVYQERNSEDENQSVEVPASRKWLVFASAFFILMIDVGFVYSFGTLFPVILEEFGDNRASTAAIQSVFTGIGPSSGIVTGVIAQRFGARNCGIVGGIFFSTGLLISAFATSTIYLQLSYGVVSALGFSLIYICANQTLSKLFKGQSRFACLALVSMAPGVGGIIYPYLLQWLTETFGLNGTFLLLGGAALNTVPLAVLWGVPKSRRKVRTKSNGNKPYEENHSPSENNRKSFLKNIADTVCYKPFLFLFLGVGLLVSTINIFGILAMDIYATNGLSTEDGLVALIVSNTASVPSRLIPGFANRIKCYSSIMTPILAAILGVSGMVLLSFARTFLENTVASATIGVCRGCCVGCMSVVTLKVLDVSRFSTGLGLIFGIIGLFTTATGPIYGFLRDVSGSYSIPLYTTTAALMAGLVLCTISLVLHRDVKAQEKRERSMSVFTVTRF